jgi:hypothetical protein
MATGVWVGVRVVVDEIELAKSTKAVCVGSGITGSRSREVGSEPSSHVMQNLKFFDT